MKQRTKKEWQALILEQPQSKLSIAEFCKQQDISVGTFYSRKSEFAKSNKSSDFIKVKQVVKHPVDPATIELHHLRSRVSLPLSVSPEWLAKMLKALA